MSTRVTILHRYLAPFLAGMFMAGASVATHAPLAVVLITAGLGFAWASLPAGGRTIERMLCPAD